MENRSRKNICIEDRKIIIEKDMLLEASIGILKNLEDKSLLKAYLYLDEIGNKIKSSIHVFKNEGKTQSNMDIIKGYRNIWKQHEEQIIQLISIQEKQRIF